MDMFTNLIMVIISQCTCMSNHHMEYLKFAHYIIVNDILHHCDILHHSDMLHHSITIISMSVIAIKLEKILMPAPHPANTLFLQNKFSCFRTHNQIYFFAVVYWKPTCFLKFIGVIFIKRIT